MNADEFCRLIFQLTNTYDSTKLNGIPEDVIDDLLIPFKPQQIATQSLYDDALVDMASRYRFQGTFFFDITFCHPEYLSNAWLVGVQHDAIILVYKDTYEVAIVQIDARNHVYYHCAHNGRGCVGNFPMRPRACAWYRPF